MRKCIEFIVEGRRPVNDRKKMEKECYEEEVQPYWKMDYKPIIIILLHRFYLGICRIIKYQKMS